MSSAKKIVANEDYQSAVKQRRSDIFKQQAANIIKEAQHEENLAKARRVKIMDKQQKKIDAKKAEISGYQNKLNRAKQSLESDTYGLIGVGTLIVFGFLIIITFILHHRHYGRAVTYTLLASLASLGISLVSQSLSLEIESKVRLLETKIEIAKQELAELIKPSQF